MKVVIQRVSEASVLIDGLETRSIGQGLMILLGITHDDTQEDIEWLSKKIVQMRIFPDDEGVMNKSILECRKYFIDQSIYFTRIHEKRKSSFVYQRCSS